ncbi:OmpA family protein [Cellvibrio sp.]|uniref:OmpA family protein n=1 Tax=Cellvibrio sp. TaxID=1965322 RepID=UPI00396489FD
MPLMCIGAIVLLVSACAAKQHREPYIEMDVMQAHADSDSAKEGEYIYCDVGGLGAAACKKNTPKTTVNVIDSSNENGAVLSGESINLSAKNAIASAMKREKIASVLFDFDSAVFKEEQKQYLKGALHGYSGGQLLAIGYTDSFGAKDLNARLSKKRAENVKDFLMKLLGDAGKIESNGKELCCYLVPFGGIKEQQSNRRVEVYLVH